MVYVRTYASEDSKAATNKLASNNKQQLAPPRPYLSLSLTSCAIVYIEAGKNMGVFKRWFGGGAKQAVRAATPMIEQSIAQLRQIVNENMPMVKEVADTLERALRNMNLQVSIQPETLEEFKHLVSEVVGVVDRAGASVDKFGDSINNVLSVAVNVGIPFIATIVVITVTLLLAVAILLPLDTLLKIMSVIWTAVFLLLFFEPTYTDGRLLQMFAIATLAPIPAIIYGFAKNHPMTPITNFIARHKLTIVATVIFAFLLIDMKLEHAEMNMNAQLTTSLLTVKLLTLNAPASIQKLMSPFTIKDFSFSGCGDKNGVLYYIGSDGGSMYTNPYKRGRVNVEMSSINKDIFKKDSFVDHGECDNFHTENEPNAWMAVDLGAQHLLQPTFYSLKTPNVPNLHNPRHWRLEGSNSTTDASSWRLVREHGHDESLSGSCICQPWKIEDVTDSYRYFRIRQTGFNSAGDNYLIVNSIELYGKLTIFN